MITSINASNAGRYTALFKEATATLQKKDAKYSEIFDLEGYFSVIEELVGIDKKYTILPLDEDYFEIDANTRTITVPAGFKKNGIAVQGDEIAEIVYFRVNRYFDFTDLDTTEIVIQWETDTQSGVSTPWVRDIESDPDYLIFGWPIDSRITANAGTIKFSVRFLMWDKTDVNNPVITYSLSTLTAQAIVNPGLDFSESELVPDDMSNLIMNRITNTTPAGASTADNPIFLLAMDTSEVDLGEDGTYTFKVQAYSPDAGILSYMWDKDGVTLTGKVDYEAVDKETDTPDDRKTYYTASVNDEGETIYIPITTLAGKDSFEEVVGTVYEQFAYLTVNSVGEYSAVAQNRVNKSTAKTVSGPTVIPGPDNSVITFVLADPIMRADDYIVVLSPVVTNDSTTNLSYQWYKDGEIIADATSATYSVVGDGETADIQGNYSLKVTAKRNGASISTESDLYWITYAAQAPKAVALGADYYTAGEVLTVDKVTFENDYYNGQNTYSYQWYKVKSDNTKEAIAGAEESSYTTSSAQGGVKICCGVKNNYNGTISDEVYSTVIVLSAAD